MKSQLVTTLACWMAGEFENRTQALENPAWFVHLHLWHRPLLQKLAGKLALFAEQANVLNLKQAYRQRVMLLSETELTLQVEYWHLNNLSSSEAAELTPACSPH